MKLGRWKRETSFIIWSLFCALTLIAIAFFFKGHPASNWLEATLFGGPLAIWALRLQRMACDR
jgi:hypothetical protein